MQDVKVFAPGFVFYVSKILDYSLTRFFGWRTPDTQCA